MNQIPGAAEAAFLAYTFLAVGSAVGNTHRFVLGVPLLVIAFGWGWISAFRIGRASPPVVRSPASDCRWLSILAMAGVLASPPQPTPLWFQIAHRALPAIALVWIGVFEAGSARWRRVALWSVVCGTVALAMLTPLVLPHPRIDVWVWNQECARALLRGVHPYTVQAPNVYEGAFNYGYHTYVLPYMPLIIVANAPGVALFGDYRYLLALCIPLTIYLLRSTGRRLNVEPRSLDVLTLALVLHPRIVYITAFGWSESMMMAALAAFVFFEVRKPGGIASSVCFFLLPSLKQYVAAPVLLYLDLRPRLRSLAVGILVASLIFFSFVLWNRVATINGLMFQMRHPTFRYDSFSLTALVATATGYESPKSLGIITQFAGAAIAWWMVRGRGLPGVLVASGLSLFASFLFGSQAFMNYYLFVEVLFLFAVLVLDRRDEARA
jgi:hypothetical protein